MITFTESVPDFDTYNEILGYDPKRSLFFDIETTGFSPSSSMVFLIGVLFFDEECWKLTQFLAEGPEDESAVLCAFLDTAARYDTIVHFNGSTFDVPYLTKKADSYGMAHTLEHSLSLDLYKKYRFLGKILSLERMNQSSLEAFIGWQRKDRLTGKHMVSLFQKYAVSGDFAIRDLLLLHNHDDMIGMTKILGISAYIPLLYGDFDSLRSVRYIPATLLASLTLAKPIPAAFSIHNGPYHLHAEGCRATLQIELYEGTLCHFFPNYKEYYYLPLEDQAIHKSVATYVDKEYRVPAKACNCYIKKSGQFLPQPEEVILPAFKRSFDDSELYFSYSDEFISSPEKLNDYISAVLCSFTGLHTKQTAQTQDTSEKN